MNWQARMAKGLLLLCGVMTLAGCQSRFLTNRYYDFRDTVELAAGVTAENPVTGILPPSFGAYVEVTDFAHLGWITHNGYTAELDLRGTFVGPDSYTRAGFLWWQYLRRNQAYEHAAYMNPFKDKDFSWCTRMESYLLSHHGRPAKRLHYEFWAPYAHEGTLLLHRGWQYWGYTGAEVAISEPFLTHMGVMLRLGIDPSEISDFLLGWFGVDYKHDDMLPSEYKQFRNWPEAVAVVAEREPVVEVEGETLPVPPSQPAEQSVRFEDWPEMQVIYFDYDKSNIRPDQMPRISHNLDVLEDAGDVPVQIIGHCDERGTIEYNYNLGLRRARSVRDYLVTNGIDADRIMIQSRGEEEPVALGHNEEAWAQNRRAEFKKVFVIEASTQP